MPDPTDPTAAGGAAAAAAPPPPDPAAPEPGPGGAPMLTPQQKPAGKQQSGAVLVQVAIHSLLLAAQKYGGKGEEFSAILEAITKLTKKFGKGEDEAKALVPAEMQTVLGAAKPGAMPGALQGAIQQRPPMAA
jgi:hypothetical protein